MGNRASSALGHNVATLQYKQTCDVAGEYDEASVTSLVKALPTSMASKDSKFIKGGKVWQAVAKIKAPLKNGHTSMSKKYIKCDEQLLPSKESVASSSEAKDTQVIKVGEESAAPSTETCNGLWPEESVLPVTQQHTDQEASRQALEQICNQLWPKEPVLPTAQQHVDESAAEQAVEQRCNQHWPEEPLLLTARQHVDEGAANQALEQQTSHCRTRLCDQLWPQESALRMARQHVDKAAAKEALEQLCNQLWPEQALLPMLQEYTEEEAARKATEQLCNQLSPGNPFLSTMQQYVDEGAATQARPYNLPTVHFHVKSMDSSQCSTHCPFSQDSVFDDNDLGSTVSTQCPFDQEFGDLQ